MIWLPFRLLSNIRVTECFNYKARFNGVYSRDNLSRIKEGAYAINLDYKPSKGTH